MAPFDPRAMTKPLIGFLLSWAAFTALGAGSLGLFAVAGDGPAGDRDALRGPLFGADDLCDAGRAPDPPEPTAAHGLSPELIERVTTRARDHVPAEHHGDLRRLRRAIVPRER